MLFAGKACHSCEGPPPAYKLVRLEHNQGAGSVKQVAYAPFRNFFLAMLSRNPRIIAFNSNLV
jgi:hypothetical protein